MRRSLSVVHTLVFVSAAAALMGAPAAPTADRLTAAVDRAAADVLARTGAPSVSVAILQGGTVTFVKAYGQARLSPALAATPEMRYSVGSISKQFTATAILLLAEQGKLSLDEPVGRFLPTLTRANEVTIRELLSHTSGYQDYWPQDYVMPMMLQATTPERIVDLFAKKPLDFDPGTKWQYSNTNYVIAGLIVEKASGMPLMTFLGQRIFKPVGMTTVTDINEGRLSGSDPSGYLRYALGPFRPAPKEGVGWLFGAGELAMTAADLGRWDASIAGQTLLRPASYRQLETDTLLKNGLSTGYGLGVEVGTVAGHRAISHTGEVSGFTASNIVFPDDRAAIAVLTNDDAATAADAMSHTLAPVVVTATDPDAPKELEEAQRIFDGLQHGTIDRTLFTDNANSYFSAQALQDFASSLGPLGPPQSFVPAGQSSRGGMIERSYRVRFAAKTLRVWTYELPDGKLEQFQVTGD